MVDKIVPTHVAIIMDGNGRWAKNRKLPRTAGHKEGVKTAQNIIKACGEAGVKYLTLFAFSSENWNRPRAEVTSLMELFLRSLENEVGNLNENGVRLKFLGQSEELSEKLSQKIKSAEQLTECNDKLFLNVAVNYGGKWDLLQSVKKLIEQVQNGSLLITDINESVLESKLSTATMPAPDLFIRTGGEKRISNFLLWQLAYTELYFSDILWPDFDTNELKNAFNDYASRQRRYGLIQEQVTE